MAVEMHGADQAFGWGFLADVGEIGEQGFQARGEHLDAAGEIAVGDDAGHGDGEAEDGGGERLGDAAGDGEVVGSCRRGPGRW